MGLRNTVMGIGAMAMLIVTNPYVMSQVLGILVLVVLPSLWLGRRVRKLSRASQDRVADSSAIAAEVLNAIPVVQSYVQGRARRSASTPPPSSAFETARRRTARARSWWSPSSSLPPSARCCGACTRARRRCWPAHQRRPPGADGGVRHHPGQRVAVLSEVYGDLPRRRATERLMELLASPQSPDRPPRRGRCPPTRGGYRFGAARRGLHYPRGRARRGAG